MSTPKFHNCDEPGCERLTSGEMCDLHREEEDAIETQAQTNADVRLKQIKAGELLSWQWEERADKINALRTELAELRGPGGRSNNHPQPVFTNQFERDFS